MNTIKKIAMFLVLIFIQNKLSAQSQNDSSTSLPNINSSTSISNERKINTNSNLTQFLKPISLQSLSTPDSTSVAPRVFDPLSMDSKPE